MQILHTDKNIFDLPLSKAEAVCVTTNGIIKKDKTAVMGAGIAKEANTRFNLSAKLGEYLYKYGNRTFYMGVYKNGNTKLSVITFPTKHDWRNDSDLGLIRTSALQLKTICNKYHITKCYLPPVGCGMGNLNFDTQVRPIIEPLLDDRFIIVFRDKPSVTPQP